MKERRNNMHIQYMRKANGKQKRKKKRKSGKEKLTATKESGTPYLTYHMLIFIPSHTNIKIPVCSYIMLSLYVLLVKSLLELLSDY